MKSQRGWERHIAHQRVAQRCEPMQWMHRFTTTPAFSYWVSIQVLKYREQKLIKFIAARPRSVSTRKTLCVFRRHEWRHLPLYHICLQTIALLLRSLHSYKGGRTKEDCATLLISHTSVLRFGRHCSTSRQRSTPSWPPAPQNDGTSSVGVTLKMDMREARDCSIQLNGSTDLDDSFFFPLNASVNSLHLKHLLSFALPLVYKAVFQAAHIYMTTLLQ